MSRIGTFGPPISSDGSSDKQLMDHILCCCVCKTLRDGGTGENLRLGLGGGRHILGFCKDCEITYPGSMSCWVCKKQISTSDMATYRIRNDELTECFLFCSYSCKKTVMKDISQLKGYPFCVFCVICGKEAKKMQVCATCKNASYCSKKCQRDNWPAHKKICKPYK